MLQPKKHKFRKAFKGRIKGDAKGGTDLNFGSYGMKALEPERITARQIEAARRAITRHIKRQGRLRIRIFPDVPVQRSLPKSVRVRARVRSSTGQLGLSPAGSCSNSTVWPVRWQQRLSAALR